MSNFQGVKSLEHFLHIIQTVTSTKLFQEKCPNTCTVNKILYKCICTCESVYMVFFSTVSNSFRSEHKIIVLI